MDVKYAPDGDRVYRKINDTSTTTERFYVVDNAGKYSQILLEIDPDNSNSIEKTYIYAHNQIIAQHDGDQSDTIYYYLHDRLGSVRLLIDSSGNVKKSYTFDPYGNLLENYDDGGNIENSYLFTGQFFDNQINQYYLRARQYDPQLQRFTSIDPVRGSFQEPFTLHQYLYCLNDPVNRWDPDGKFFNYPSLLLGTSTGRTIQVQHNAIVIPTGLKAAAKLIIYTTAAYLATTYAILEADHFMGAMRKMNRKYERNHPPSGYQQFKNNFYNWLKWGVRIGILYELHDVLRQGCDTSEWEKLIEDRQSDYRPDDPQLEPDRDPDIN